MLEHELAHIINGHIDYSIIKKGNPLIAEFGANPKTVDDAIESQALEVDADHHAALHVIKLVEHAMQSGVSQNPHMRTYEDYIFAGAFSMFVFAHEFGDMPLAKADLCRYSHPPARFRLRTIVNGMAEGINLNPRTSFGQLSPVIEKAAMEAEFALHHLTGSAVLGPERYSEGFGPIGTEHFARLNRRWEGGLNQEVQKHGYR